MEEKRHPNLDPRTETDSRILWVVIEETEEVLEVLVSQSAEGRRRLPKVASNEWAPAILLPSSPSS